MNLIRESRPGRDRARVAFAAGILLAAVGSLVAFGVLGVGRRGATREGDARLLHCAGQLWAAGADAYDPAEAQDRCAPEMSRERYDFAYPPQIAPLALILALFPLDQARVLFVVLTL